MDDSPTRTPTLPRPDAQPAPTGSTFLVAEEILLWTLYTVSFIMVMVVYMMN
ncbi:MAG: hypothetical protein R3B06_09395 [Kofleriaceae bacterium]